MQSAGRLDGLIKHSEGWVNTQNTLENMELNLRNAQM